MTNLGPTNHSRLKEQISSPDLTFQTRTVQSHDAEATRFPVQSATQALTHRVWPLSRATLCINIT